jgi:predicted nucleotidyltransferase component of viral defense system
MLIEVLSNFDDVSKEDLSEAKIVKGVKRVSLNKYLRDKLQCLCERTEARDLADIFAVLQKFPKLVNFAHQCLLQIDLVLLSQRLLDWNDEALKSDLLKYNDIKFDEVKAMRDKMLAWIKEIS